jgi:hypothetical protein
MNQGQTLPKLNVGPYEFETILIQNFEIDKIDAASFGKATAHKLIIENNEQLDEIDKNLWRFNTTVLVVRSNKNLNGDKLVKNIGTSTELQTIELTDINITSIDSKAFVGLSGLKYVFLQKNKIQKIQANAFKELRYLEEIRLDQNEIHTLNIDSLAFDSSSTVNINLNFNELSQFIIGDLNVSKEFGGKSGMNLYLEDNYIEDIPINAFEILLNNSKNTIFLYNNKINCTCDLKDLTMKISRMQFINLRCINKDNIDIFRLNRDKFCNPPSTPSPSTPKPSNTTSSDTTTNNTTSSDTTTSNTTSSDTTTNNTTSSDTTTNNTTSSDTTTSNTTSSDTTTNNTTSSDTATNNTTSSDTTTNNTTSSDTATNNTTSSDTTTNNTASSDTTTI